MLCQNLFMSTGQYCGAPALELEGYRNICLPCHLRALESTERVVREYLSGVDRAAWLERDQQHRVNIWSWVDHLLLVRAPMSQIMKARAEAHRYEHLSEIVKGM